MLNSRQPSLIEEREFILNKLEYLITLNEILKTIENKN
jgi:hypothetical protein